MDFIIKVLRTLFNFLFTEHQILGCLILPLVLPTIVFCTPIVVRFIKNLNRFGEAESSNKKAYCSVAVIMALLHIAFLLIVILSFTMVIPMFPYWAYLGEFSFSVMFFGVLFGVLSSIVGAVLGINFFLKGCHVESKAPEWLYIVGTIVISIVSGLLYLIVFSIVQGLLLEIQKRVAAFCK